jgi:hypothetical protein
MVEVTSIRTERGGRQAVAEYKTAYKNVNDFHP